MNLYLVTCVCRKILSDETLDVYVVSPDFEKAASDALSLMRMLKYKFIDSVSNVQLLASVNSYAAPALLKMPEVTEQ